MFHEDVGDFRQSTKSSTLIFRQQLVARSFDIVAEN